MNPFQTQPYNVIPIRLGGTNSTDPPSARRALGISEGASLINLVSILDYPANGVSGALVDPTGVLNSTLGIQAAHNAALHVDYPPGTYLVSDTISPPNSGIGRGAGRATIINFTGVGKPFIKLGTSDSVLNYKNEISSMQINLVDKSSMGVKLNATCGAVVRDLYIEGAIANLGTRTNIGIDIDGKNISAFFNSIENVLCNHIHKGFFSRTTGSTQPTENVFINCTSLGDFAAGDTTSIGFDFSGSADSVLIGGNCEDCGTGIIAQSSISGIKSWGMRYEGNSRDLELVAGVTNCSFLGSSTLTKSKVLDSTGSPTNNIEYGVDSNDSLPWTPVDASGGTMGAITVNSARYTKVRNMIFASFDVTFPANADATNAKLGGLPYTAETGNRGGGACHFNSGGAVSDKSVRVVSGTKTFQFYAESVTLMSNAGLTGTTLQGNIIYSV